MQNVVIITAALFGGFAIILGAFGAHAFKKILSAEKLESFEVGVRYQMYAALTLLILGFNFRFELQSERVAFYLITLGTILFSVSIYFLSFAEYWKKNLKFLGPITPLGGLLMIAGWVAVIVRFL
ncbi:MULTISPECIES: DUF423 domain-containing protein [Sphingobacterium]|jgi:uncharacterized membrane protein YgdD (TMEM256/DUF423 family)|uniref:DUF423 domain-containing protein n=1 Tax=Sphingobacterium multivorum TaxID=28454 RepID=A0A654DQ24_SPHMU|nr:MULTISPECIES: DUF423 domain-containing protein [Sphingobacterium]HAE66177.1 DUF423 domain-containing protein [Sphingobacterium sp.]OJZ13965.1 MAG: hypothetical protein BGP15_06280 [Sphingobacterium sp. 40-24]QQT46512.1 DUF423 domain-containing protein [Sphingobacterium multivorum]QQT60881.1 DUF423 domain-containing protein [Sphingobacterium multivorum]SUJ90034.1 Protein of uncharacterised function (DUF423) [Sphingobacterium multivorum]